MRGKRRQSWNYRLVSTEMKTSSRAPSDGEPQEPSSPGAATARRRSSKSVGRTKAASDGDPTPSADSGTSQDRAPADYRPTVFLPGRPEKKAEILARQILDDVLSNGLPVGTSLPNELAMMAHYGVGRITIREALRILEVLGLLSIRSGSSGGPVVAEVTSRDYGRMSALFFRAAGARLADLLEARSYIEGTAARLAAERRDATSVERLRRLVDQMNSPSSGDDQNTAFLQISREFHEIVSSMSGNLILDMMSSALVNMVVDRLAGFVYPIEKRSEVNEHHLAIARAILRGNGVAAERLMLDHMTEYRKYAFQGWSGALSQVITWR